MPTKKERNETPGFFIAFKRQERHPWSSCHHWRERNQHVSTVFNTDRGEDCSVPKLEVLASFQGKLGLGLADSALQSQHDLLGGLRLLVKDGLSLTSITGLLAVITTLSLGEQRGLENGGASLVYFRGCWHSRERERTFPALYWVTLCCVCFLQDLPLQ